MMIRKICLSFLYLFGSGYIFQPQAQNSLSYFTLFETVALQAKSDLPADEIDRTYIELSPQLFGQTSTVLKAKQSLEFSLQSLDHNLKIQRIETYFDGITSFTAINEENGSTLIATLSQSRLTAKYHDHYSQALRHIRFDPTLNSHYIATIDLSEMDILSCGHDDHAQLSTEVQTELIKKTVEEQRLNKTLSGTQSASASTSQLSSLSISNMAGSQWDTTTIDILYVYTQAAEDFAKSCRVNQSRGCESVSDINELLAQATILSQAALDNSFIPIKLRPVFAYKTDYDETKDEVNSGKRLQRLTTSTKFNPSNWNAGGYMEEVHEYRDQYGADLVAGIFSVSDVGGIAWLLNSPRGYPEIGFSLNRVQQVLSGYTLVHEIGHNLGNSHSRTQSANPADIYGGLFHYSVGYQWVTETEAFSSVMAYLDQMATLNGDTVRSVEVPVFSSPDVIWKNSEAGTYSDLFGPANAAQNNREIKQAIANYRPTKTTPPSLSVDTQEIATTMNREDSFEFPVKVANNGLSDLMWYITITNPQIAKSINSGIALKDVRAGLSDEELPIREMGVNQTTAGRSNIFAKADESGIIYSEDFEDFKPKLFGGYQALRGWRTDDVKNMFLIKATTPSSGKNHMRIESGTPESWNMESPYFGPQGEGVFDIEFDLSVTKDPNTGGFNYFDISLYDSKTLQRTAGIAINSQLSILTMTLSEDSTVILRDTGEDLISDVTQNTYRKIRIKLNTSTNRIEYYVDGKQELGSAFIGGRSVDFLYFSIIGGENPKSFIDIDDIVIKRPYFYEWMDVADYGGTVAPGGEEEVIVKFNTVGIEQGEYSTTLQLITNDPEQLVTNIPISLTVNSTVPVEETPELPTKAEISSIYPNPFNPSTTIQVNLPVTGLLNLAVYDVTGRKITQLVEENRSAGSHTFVWDASDFSSGLYFIRLQSEGQLQTKAITLIK